MNFVVFTHYKLATPPLQQATRERRTPDESIWFCRSKHQSLKGDLQFLVLKGQ